MFLSEQDSVRDYTEDCATEDAALNYLADILVEAYLNKVYGGSSGK